MTIFLTIYYMIVAVLIFYALHHTDLKIAQRLMASISWPIFLVVVILVAIAAPTDDEIFP